MYLCAQCKCPSKMFDGPVPLHFACREAYYKSLTTLEAMVLEQTVRDAAFKWVRFNAIKKEG